MLIASLCLAGCAVPSGTTSAPGPTAIPTIEQGISPGGVILERVCFNEVAILLEGDVSRWVVVEFPGLYERIVDEGVDQREFTWDLGADDEPGINALIINDNSDPTCSDTMLGLDVGERWLPVNGTVSVTVRRVAPAPTSCGEDRAGMMSVIDLQDLRFERPDGQVVAVEDLTTSGDLGFVGPDC